MKSPEKSDFLEYNETKNEQHFPIIASATNNKQQTIMAATAAVPPSASKLRPPPPPTPPPAGSPNRRSRFQFHSDTKAPTELKEFSTQAYKRHTEFRKRVNDLDHNVAAWTSRFAEEIITREKDMVGMYDYAVAEPLERCAERFMRRMDVEFGNLQAKPNADTSASLDTSYYREEEVGNGNQSEDINGDDDPLVDQEGIDQEPSKVEQASNAAADDSNDGPSLQSLSEQISSLSYSLMEHVHITTPSLRNQHLDSFQKKFKSEIPPKLHMEKTKAAKREQAIFQKFESMAGLASRSLYEENAKRVAQLKSIEEKILEAGGWDEKRTSRFLDEVKDIRMTLKLEREERMKNDELVLENIVACRVQLHKALLDSMTCE